MLVTTSPQLAPTITIVPLVNVFATLDSNGVLRKTDAFLCPAVAPLITIVELA
jgi:hypothetical protein